MRAKIPENKKPRVKPPYIALALLILAWLLDFVFPELRFIEKPYSSFGFFVIACGISLTVWGVYSFRKSNTPIIPGEKPKALVMKGPYKFMRNPMYSGIAIALIGASFYFGNILSFLSPLIFFIIMNYYFVPFEENLMERTFGKKYLDYKDKVRRWL